MIRIGIIGTGGISHCHMMGYNQLVNEGKAELVACCDIDESKVKAYGEKYGFARTYTDCREMMANETLDCVSVCTWNAAHMECTELLLRAAPTSSAKSPWP